jgi:hypothetical protein
MNKRILVIGGSPRCQDVIDALERVGEHVVVVENLNSHMPEIKPVVEEPKPYPVKHTKKGRKRKW